MKKLLASLALGLLIAAPDAVADTTIYYDNSSSQWDTVNIHYWSTPSTTWPGVSLTKVEGDIWKYTFEGNGASTISGFLFCNASGTDQTADYTKGALDNHLYKGVGGKGQVTDLGVYDIDPDLPSISISPADCKFTDEITVTISVAPAGTIYFSTRGDATTSSTIYTGPLTFTETTDLSVLAVNNGKEARAEAHFTKRGAIPVQTGNNLITDYYLVNPNGKCGTRKTVNMAFNDQKSTTALSNWTEEDLIARGVARDVCMAFKGKHERPVIDSYAIYAAYDDNNLYLGLQTVYTIWDKWGEGKQPGESKPYNMDGAMIWAFDLDPYEKFDGRINGNGPIWQEANNGFFFDNGVDAVWIGSSKPGVGVPGFFIPTPDGHASYDAAYCKSIPGRYYGYADGLLPSINEVWGQADFEYDPEDLKGNDGFVDLRSEVDDSAHTFYEWTFPLSILGITAADIEQTGIGVMYIDQYGTSPVGGTPYDPSYFDVVKESYSKDESTSKEKEDDDIITYAPARIGRVNSVGINQISTPANDAPAAFYTLQGVRVENPGSGIYIRVIGGKADKVIL